MVSADPLLFPSSSSLQRETAWCVVASLLAAEDSGNQPEPTALGAEGEGGNAPGPPQRDKTEKSKFNLGASLHEQDQLKVLAMLEDNVDRFAFSLEDIEPSTGEPLHINLNSDKPIFRPPHKLGQVEWDFVEA